MSDRESIRNDVEWSQRQDDRELREEAERMWCANCGGRRESGGTREASRWHGFGQPATCECYCTGCNEFIGDKSNGKVCALADCEEFGKARS